MACILHAAGSLLSELESSPLLGYGIKRGTHRISLKEFDGSDNWVEIKAGQAWGQRLAQATAGLKLGVGPDGQAKTDFDFGLSRLEKFRKAIVAWSLRAEDEDPEPMPLDLETFTDVLKDEVGDWLAQQIDDYYGARLPNPKNSGSGTAN